MYDDAQTILDSFRKTTIVAAQKRHPNQDLQLGRWRIQVGSVSAEGLIFEGNDVVRLSIHVLGFYEESKGTERANGIVFHVGIPLEELFFRTEVSDKPVRIENPKITISPESLQSMAWQQNRDEFEVLRKTLFECTADAGSSIPNERIVARTCIAIPGKTWNLLRNWVNAWRGFPASSSGHFVRMLYLSASTLATLGLGDIVPITTRARLLVTLESVLGPILIGLFLNSLASEVAERPSSTNYSTAEFRLTHGVRIVRRCHIGCHDGG